MKKVFVALFVLVAFSLASCGYSVGDWIAAKDESWLDGYDKGYAEGYEEGYEDGYNEGYEAPKPIAKPASGTILSGKEYSGSEIKVTASSSYDYVVSLKDSRDREYVCFYVRAGDTVTIDVPSKKLYVYFASGKQWYGYGKGLMFGEDTSYSKDDECRDFAEYTWEYTLYPVNDGNFSETPSNENEFF